MLSSGSRPVPAIASANGGRSSRRHDTEEMIEPELLDTHGMYDVSFKC